MTQNINYSKNDNPNIGIDSERLDEIIKTTSKEEILSKLPFVKKGTHRYFGKETPLEYEVDILEAIINESEVSCIYVVSYDKKEGEWIKISTPLFSLDTETAKEKVKEYNKEALGKLWGENATLEVGTYVLSPENGEYIKEEFGKLLAIPDIGHAGYSKKKNQAKKLLKILNIPKDEQEERLMLYLNFEYVNAKMGEQGYVIDEVQKNLYNAKHFDDVLEKYKKEREELLTNKTKAFRRVDDWRESEKLIVSHLNADDINKELMHVSDEFERLDHFAKLYTREIDTVLEKRKLNKGQREKLLQIKQEMISLSPDLKKEQDYIKNKCIDIENNRFLDEGKILLHSSMHLFFVLLIQGV